MITVRNGYWLFQFIVYIYIIYSTYIYNIYIYNTQRPKKLHY